MGTLTFVSVIVTLLVTFRGPAHGTAFITLVFPSAGEMRLPFQVGIIWLFIFVLWAFRVGFLLLTVHVYSED